MTEVQHRRPPKQLMTPLWVISLFVSLTEVVTGIAVTQASGGTQAALTAFVIGFPLLIASAFFLILWHRPYVFYPPSEYAGGVDVTQYVGAMKPAADAVRADLQAEVANLTTRLELQDESHLTRIKEMEELLSDIARQTESTQRAFEDYRASVAGKTAASEQARLSFEERSRYRIHVASVTKHPPSAGERSLVDEIASRLQKAGYRTSTSAWSSYSVLVRYKDAEQWFGIRIIYEEGKRQLAEEVATFLRTFNVPPVELVTDVEASAHSLDVPPHSLLSEGVDLTVAYCLS